MASRSFCLINSNGKRVESTTTHAISLTSGTNGGAISAVNFGTIVGIARYDILLVRLTSDALLDNAGHTATLDLVLQRLLDGPNGTTWDDYCYLAREANLTALDSMTLLNGEDDLSSYGADKGDVTWAAHNAFTALNTTGLSAGERRPGHWGSALRLVGVLSANTTAATVVTLDITAEERP